MAVVKRLFRSSKDKVLGGVCAGIADYFHVDPVLVRLLWVIFSIWPLHILGGILAYILAYIIMPEK